MPPKAKTRQARDRAAEMIPGPPGKRYPLNMRTTRELRERIEAAARASGRSLVQEVEFRLEQSFAEEDQTRLVRETVELTLNEYLYQIVIGVPQIAKSKALANYFLKYERDKESKLKLDSKAVKALANFPK